MCNPATDNPPRIRRWTPLSLRIFAIVLAILGVVGLLGVGIPLYGRHNAITDQGMKHLTEMRELIVLNIQNTRIGDDGIIQLAQLPQLTTLDLTGTDVTEIGIARLAQAKPQLQIKRLDSPDLHSGP